jgi:hypothetical protein
MNDQWLWNLCFATTIRKILTECKKNPLTGLALVMRISRKESDDNRGTAVF